jgi:hypothetical protein
LVAGSNPAVLMRGLEKVTHRVPFFDYLKGGDGK